MRVVVRSAGVVLLAILAAILLALTSTVKSVFTLAATTTTTALIMGGTGHPLSFPQDSILFVQQYMGTAVDNYIAPASMATPPTGIPPGIPPGSYNRVAVVTPEQFWPTTGLTAMTFDKSVAQGVKNLDNCINASGCVYNPYVGSTAPQSTDTFVVFGYSQSATVATFEKRNLATQYPVTGTGPNVSFVLIANPNRPNGGILERFQGLYIPILGVTFNGATLTNTQYPTVDVTRQYDGWSDFPTNPLNLLADANAIAGIYYLHGDYGSVGLGNAVLQDQYGDTKYSLIPTQTLPLLMPLEALPIVGPVLADTLDPPLRVLVEAGYNRTISPGQPTTANFLYSPNPIALGVNFLVAIPTGLDNGLQDITGTRPFETQPPGPYGVGGPPVTMSPTTNQLGGPPVTMSPTANQQPQQQAATNVAAPAPATAPAQPTVRSNTNGATTTATEPTTPSTPVATKPTLPKIREPIGSDLPQVKHLATSLTKAFKPSTTAKNATGNEPVGAGASGSAARIGDI